MAVLLVNLVLIVVSVAATDVQTSIGYATVVAYRIADPLLLVLLAGVVASAVLIDPVPTAGALALTATALAGVLVLLGIGAAAYGLTAPVSPVDAATPLIGLAVSTLALALLIKVTMEGRSRGDRVGARPRATLGPTAPAALESGPDSSPTPVPDPQLQPTWQADSAAGAAWLTAGDAASGAPATGWGSTTSEFSGWRALPASPSPTDPPAPDPDRTTRRAPEPPPPAR